MLLFCNFCAGNKKKCAHMVSVGSVTTDVFLYYVKLLEMEVCSRASIRSFSVVGDMT